MSKKATHKKIQEYLPEQILKEESQFIHQWSRELQKDLPKWQLKHTQVIIPQTPKEIWLSYLGFLAEYMNDDRFNPESDYSVNSDSLKNGQTLKSWLLSQGLVNLSRQNKLLVSIKKQCVAQLGLLSFQLLQKIILFIRVLSKGFISINGDSIFSLQQIGRSAHNQSMYYQYQLDPQAAAIVCMGMEKIPFFSKSGKKVEFFELGLSIEIQKILINCQKIKNVIAALDQEQQYSLRFKFNHKDFPVDQSKKKEHISYFSFNQKNEETTLLRKYEILRYQKLFIREYQSYDYLFNLASNKYFAYRRLLTQRAKKQLKQTQQQNKEHKYRYPSHQVSYIRAKQYVEYIGSIPDFKFKLTKQQKEAIGKQGNTIVIGRSGTGKTLLAILRLYSIEYLTKEALIYQRISIQNPKIECVHYYLNKTLGEKNMFLTASPYLIQQILKQYDDMNYQVQSKHKNTCSQCKENLKLQINAEDDQDLQRLLYKIEKRQNIVDPISTIDRVHFPQFLTIKSMIVLIDCGLKRPFFDIKATKLLKNNKHVINIYYHPENMQLLATKGKDKSGQQSELDKKIGFIEAVEINYSFFQRFIWAGINDAYYRNKKGEKYRLNPAVVWVQIFSIIKGSAKAHANHLKCLSPKSYLQQSKNKLLSQQQKIDIYYLFEAYERWKTSNKAYDLMDVVNHILQQMMFDGYKDEFVDYIFVDQVQDLTPATIYLISKMAKKNIFYCGDTAQAISKGVSFKFSEIKTLFSKKYFKNCIQKEISDESSLTVNFRSHNKILMLANAIVSMIEQLFPKMIDVLQKQQSDLFGPANLVIDNGDYSLIYDILLGPKEGMCNSQQPSQLDIQVIQKQIGTMNQGQQQQIEEDEDEDEDDPQRRRILMEQTLMKRQLQSEQVILVRNSEEKSKLPKFLRKQTTLTCQEVKGLEFQDVVIYNFFGSSPCKNKWALLNNLDINDFFVDPKEFEGKLSRRAVEEGNKAQGKQLSQEQKIELGFNFEQKKYNVYQIKRNADYLKIDIKDYYQISNELKQFYTLVTRAKNILIIFDTQIPRQLTKFLKKLNVVKFLVPSSSVQKIHEQLVEYRNRQSQQRYLNKKKLWNNQGTKFLTRKNYEQAIKCFQKAQNHNGVKLVNAIRIKEESSFQLHQIEAQLLNPEKLPKEEFKMKKIKLQENKNTILQKLEQAGYLFKQINSLEKASRIFAQAENYEQATACFLQLKNFGQAAQCFYKSNNYSQALKYFEKTKNVSRIFDCLVKLQRWAESFSLLQQHKQTLELKVINNQKISANIKICLKQVLSKLISQNKVIKNEIEFNKGFRKLEADIKLQKEMMSKGSKQMNQRLAGINEKYNQFMLGYLEQQFEKLMKQYKTLMETYQVRVRFFEIAEKQQKQQIENMEQIDNKVINIECQLDQINHEANSQNNSKFISLYFNDTCRLQLLKKTIKQLSSL